MLTISNIKKSFGDTRVLDLQREINFKNNKIHGILGNNGCGKTTLLRIISGLDDEYSGDVRYSLDSDISKQITYVKQSPYMMRGSVRDNILYPLKIRSKDNMEQILDTVIKDFRLQDLLDKDATKLSSGETQRVAIARALGFSPKLLILDEPLSNLDPEYIELIESVILDRVEKSGLTVIIVTHNLNQARRFCDYITIMHRGKIIESGNTKEVLNNPTSEITKRFLSFA